LTESDEESISGKCTALERTNGQLANTYLEHAMLQAGTFFLPTKYSSLIIQAS
jgi:hypothetical protein